MAATVTAIVMYCGQISGYNGELAGHNFYRIRGLIISTAEPVTMTNRKRRIYFAETDLV